MPAEGSRRTAHLCACVSALLPEPGVGCVVKQRRGIPKFQFLRKKQHSGSTRATSRDAMLLHPLCLAG